VELEAFELVLLRRPQNATSYPEDVLRRIQDEHLAYHARQLAEADPAVRAGRLTVEIMTWYCPPGTMSQPGRLVLLP
jgi:hypothetical protein